MSKTFQSKYDSFTLLGLVLLLLFIMYQLRSHLSAVVFTFLIGYYQIARGTRYNYFHESKLIVKYPLKIVNRKREIKYTDIETVIKKTAFRHEGPMLIINYSVKNSLKKLSAEMIDNEDWPILEKRFIQHDIKVEYDSMWK